MTRAVSLAGLAVTVALAGCSAGTPAPGPGGSPAAGLVHWSSFMHLPAVVDFAGPGAGGSVTVAAESRLFTLNGSGLLAPFAQGPGGYVDTTGSEAYIATIGTRPVPGPGCSFAAGATFALQLGKHPGVIGISPAGRARLFAALPAALNPGGITFDSVGRFGHRLLVIDRGPVHTAVLAIDCDGRVQTIAPQGPRMEGGISVAPASFGRFGGDLIGPDEASGRVYAIAPGGAVVTLADPRLPDGGDIGVESTGFIPAGFGPGGFAYLADHSEPNAKFQGTDSVLRLSGQALLGAGARPGDLLVATEGGARTVLIRCGIVCTVRDIGIGLPSTHAEGHIVFTAG